MSTTSLLCFNDKHKHKNRVDEDPEYRLENIRAVKDFLPHGHEIGSKNAVDRFCSLLHYTHGCYFGMSYNPDAFPDMFRHTFPEAIVSNRNIHDQKEGFRKHWNYAFVEGLIFDISTNRGRTFDMNGYPESTAYIKKLIELKQKYKEFFFGGRYSSGCDLKLPENIFAAYYTASDRQICALCNNTNEIFGTVVYGKKLTLKPSGYTVVERN